MMTLLSWASCSSLVIALGWWKGSPRPPSRLRRPNERRDRPPNGVKPSGLGCGVRAAHLKMAVFHIFATRPTPCEDHLHSRCNLHVPLAHECVDPGSN